MPPPSCWSGTWGIVLTRPVSLLLPVPVVPVPSCREIGFLSKLNCYWFFCRYFVFAIVTIVALLASPIILWLDPWVWGFPTIYFLVSANVAVVVYLYFTIFSYVFLLFSVVSDGLPCPARCLPACCSDGLCAQGTDSSSSRVVPCVSGSNCVVQTHWAC